MKVLLVLMLLVAVAYAVPVLISSPLGVSSVVAGSPLVRSAVIAPGLVSHGLVSPGLVSPAVTRVVSAGHGYAFTAL